MQRRLGLTLVLAAILVAVGATVLSLAAAGAGLEPSQSTAPFAQGRVLVKFRSPITQDGAQAILASNGLDVIEHFPVLDVYVVAAPVGQEAETIRTLQRNLSVRYAELDYIVRAQLVPDDAYFISEQWNMTQIGAPDAWDLTTGSTDVVIAIVDTGVDLGHPDLASKIVAGYDFVNRDDDAQDDEGHGTHVAGIAAAVSNNAVGIAGVSWGSPIMPVKVLDSEGSGFTSDVAAGIIWAADHGARVINLSLGGPGSSQTIQDAVNYAYGRNALIVAAAGNDYQSGNPINYPAAGEHVIGVGATTDQDGHASYSSAGSWVDITAPGGDPTSAADPNPRHWIMSTYWRGAASAGQQSIQAAYERHAGTSMSTPHVVGLAALVWSRHMDWTNDEVAWAIQSTALDRGAPGRDNLFGWGRIDARAAVALDILSPTPTITPTPTPAPSTCLIESLHPYENNTDLTWMVTNTNPSASITRIHFSQLETESGFDYVIVRDSSGTEIQRLSGLYPGGLWSSAVPGASAQVQLLTDTSVTRWGFCVDQLEGSSPHIGVAPDQFAVDIPVGGTAQRTLTISNTGQSQLNFSITDMDTTPAESVTIQLPAHASSAGGADLKTAISESAPSAQELRASRGLVAQDAAKVLIVTSDADVSDLQTALTAFPDLQVAVYNDAAVPSLAQLQAYDVVFTSDNRYWAANGIDPVALGNVLADYIDAGGKIVAANFAYDYDQWAIQGRFLDQDYGPFERATADLSNAVTLGAFTAGHPIMLGVTSVSETAIHQDQTVGSGATLVASWSDNTPLVATRPKVVGINLLASLGNGSHGWSGDAPTLLHNAIVWVAEGGSSGDAAWLTATLDAGTVSQGSSAAVTVAFDAGSLGSGIYTADLAISSNDPAMARVVVPVTMTVGGAAGPGSIAIDPAAKLAGPGGIFTLSLKISIGAPGVDAADARVTFDPQYLRVVNDAGDETQQIDPGATLPLVLLNSADNAQGLIAFSAGRGLTSTVPNGDFELATVRFKALTETIEAGTPVKFITGTNLFFGGDAVMSASHDGVVRIVPPILVGQATLQGRGQPPSDRWSGYNVQVLLFPSGAPTATNTYMAQLDASGVFTATGMRTDTYDVVIKGPHSLSNRKSGIALPSEVLPIGLGLLLEGDANGDDAVAGDDFSILAAAFASSPGHAAWDARADFNGDSIINGADFSLLATNYGKHGAIHVARPMRAASNSSVMLLAISPPGPVGVGRVFDVEIAVQAVDQGVDAVDAYIEFDSAYLRVVDASGEEAGQVASGQVLHMVLQNTVENAAGRIAFSAGRQLGGTIPSGWMKVATVHFRAAAITGASGTPIRFGANSGVFSGGVSILGGQTDGFVVVEPTAPYRVYMPQILK